jgi:uncharacterized BrkB/YihY/UPF0761 family membrane protein
MIRNTADFIVSVLVISIVGAIIFTLFLLFKSEVMLQFLNGLKNNTGNYSTYNILMWVAIFVSIYFLLYMIFKPRPIITRTKN